VIAYIGERFRGSQLNRDTPTIEKALYEALGAAGCGTPERATRCSRTDAGVSAAALIMGVELVLVGGSEEATLRAVNAALDPAVRVLGLLHVGPTWGAARLCVGRTYEYVLPAAAINEDVALMCAVLEHYRGDHDFRAFTKPKMVAVKPGEDREAAMTRTIVSATCSQPFVEGGGAYVRVVFTGKSFMIYQIRRMVGFAVALVRLCVTKRETLKAAFRIAFDPQTTGLSIPAVPALGLFLARPDFGDAFSLDRWAPDIAAFRTRIVSHIIAQERSTHKIADWVTCLNLSAIADKVL
jgi:tRNA pseudouridine38-40 synthase